MVPLNGRLFTNAFAVLKVCKVRRMSNKLKILGENYRYWKHFCTESDLVEMARVCWLDWTVLGLNSIGWNTMGEMNTYRSSRSPDLFCGLSAGPFPLREPAGPWPSHPRSDVRFGELSVNSNNSVVQRRIGKVLYLPAWVLRASW